MAWQLTVVFYKIDFSSSIIDIVTTVTIIVIKEAEITSSAVISIVEQDSLWLACCICATIYELGHGIIQCVECASLHDKFNLIDCTVLSHCLDSKCFAVLGAKSEVNPSFM